jgi:hypothetical protein
VPAPKSARDPAPAPNPAPVSDNGSGLTKRRRIETEDGEVDVDESWEETVSRVINEGNESAREKGLPFHIRRVTCDKLFERTKFVVKEQKDILWDAQHVVETMERKIRLRERCVRLLTKVAISASIAVYGFCVYSAVVGELDEGPALT